jgi:hypothetical protein
MPDGFDCIIGLDSGLNLIDLSTNLAKIGSQSFCFNVSSEEKAKVAEVGLGKLLKKHDELFTNGELWSSVSNVAPVKVELLEGSAPIKCPIIPQTEAEEENLEKEIHLMLNKGIVSRVQASKWCFPFFMTKPNAGRKARSAIDFRRLNPLLKFVPVELPTSEIIIDEIPEGTKYFSKIDLSKAYHQVKVVDTNECLVIRTRSGLYKFEVLPLGLASAVAIFQNTMENLLGDELLRSGVRVFLDDILIYSKDKKTHLMLLERVFEKLSQANFKIKKEKCLFLQPEIEFLGYILNGDGVSISEDRIQGLLQIPVPQNATQVRGLLGGLVMLRRFDARIAEITVPLNSLTSSNSDFVWGEEHKAAFERLREVLRELLKNKMNFRPDPTLPLIIQTDASNRAIGASLIQEFNVESCVESRLICAVSRSLKAAELNYSTIRRELLAVLFAVKKFHKFVAGRSFIVKTDHLPLKGLLSKPIHTIENLKLREMVTDLLDYQFEVQYVKGSDNVFADYLSRNTLDELYQYPEFKESEDELGQYVVLHKGKWKKFVLPENRRELLTTVHTSSHYGYSKMLNECSELYHWPGMLDDIRSFLSDCLCSLTKKNRRRISEWGTVVKADLYLDLYTYGPKTYLTIIDSQKDEFWALELMSKTDVLAVFTAWAESRGLDISKLTVLTDRGTEFNCLDDYLKNHIRTAAYSPYSNGKVERIHKEVSSLCRLYDTTPDQVAEMWRSGTTPVSINFNRSHGILEVGDLVLKFIQRVQSKIMDCWDGPYLVQEIIGNRMVRGLNLNTLRCSVMHFNDIKVYKRPATSDWKLNPVCFEKISQELGIENLNDFLTIGLEELQSSTLKGKEVFIDINNSVDLEEIFELLLKVSPKRVLIVLPEFKERDFWWKFDLIPGELASVPDDADSYLVNSNPAGFRIWKSWIGYFEFNQLRTVSSVGGRNNRTLSSGELMKITELEDDEYD